MSRIKKFTEDFLNEATAQVVKPTDIEIPKKIADEIVLAKELHVQIDKAIDEFKKKMAPMQTTVAKYDEDIMSKLKELNVTQMKVKNTLVTFVKEAGKTTYSYKTLWEEGLKKVNAATRAMLEAFQESIKNIGKGKEYLEYAELQKESMTEGVKEMWNKFTAWVKGWWTKLNSSIDQYVKSGEALEHLTATAKANESDISEDANVHKMEEADFITLIHGGTVSYGNEKVILASVEPQFLDRLMADIQNWKLKFKK